MEEIPDPAPCEIAPRFLRGDWELAEYRFDPLRLNGGALCSSLSICCRVSRQARIGNHLRDCEVLGVGGGVCSNTCQIQAVYDRNTKVAPALPRRSLHKSASLLKFSRKSWMEWFSDEDETGH